MCVCIMPCHVVYRSLLKKWDRLLTLLPISRQAQLANLFVEPASLAMGWGAMVLETRADYGVLNFVRHRREAKAQYLRVPAATTAPVIVDFMQQQWGASGARAAAAYHGFGARL